MGAPKILSLSSVQVDDYPFYFFDSNIWIAYLKQHGSITNREYQDISGAIVRTAARDFKKLVSVGLLKQIGITGRNAHYILVAKTGQKQDKP